MSGLTTNSLGAAGGLFETNQMRAQRMGARDNYNLLKVAGMALAAIGAVGVLFSLINGMFFTSLLSTALCVIGVDLVKIGSNGVALSESSETISRLSSAATRRRITAVLYCNTEVLYRNMLVLGACLRPLHESWVRR